VNYRSPVEPSKSLSEPSVPPEVYQHLSNVLRGLVEGYMKSTYGTDGNGSLQMSYSIDDKFFEPYVQDYYKGLLSVFHPEDVKSICSILMRTEFIMYEQALRILTSANSKTLYEMCEKVAMIDSEGSTVH
jgi:hypothetical protein